MFFFIIREQDAPCKFPFIQVNVKKPLGGTFFSAFLYSRIFKSGLTGYDKKGYIMSAKNDMIRSVCGKHKYFKGVSCRYYDLSDAQCLLLREKKMEEFWEKCRCKLFETLYNATTVCLINFKKKYKRLNIDDKEDIDFESIIKRLKTYGLKTGFTLHDWLKYMNKTVYQEIRGILVARGLIPRGIRCGTCRHLPKGNPYICPKNGETRKKADDVCDDYTQDINSFISIDIEENDDNPQAHRLMYEISTVRNENITCLPEEKDRLSDMKKILKNRAGEAKPGSKLLEKYERQYEVFINLLNLLSENIPLANAMKLIAKNYGINVKTIRRDIEEIREFLKKMSPEYEM